MQCDWLIPSFDTALTQGKVVECLRERGHKGYHLCKLPSGEFIEWMPDDECGCTEEDCECFLSRTLSRREAEDLLGAPLK